MILYTRFLALNHWVSIRLWLLDTVVIGIIHRWGWWFVWLDLSIVVLSRVLLVYSLCFPFILCRVYLLGVGFLAPFALLAVWGLRVHGVISFLFLSSWYFGNVVRDIILFFLRSTQHIFIRKSTQLAFFIIFTASFRFFMLILKNIFIFFIRFIILKRRCQSLPVWFSCINIFLDLIGAWDSFKHPASFIASRWVIFCVGRSHRCLKYAIINESIYYITLNYS